MSAGTLQVADRDRRANRTGAQGLRLDTIGGRWRLGLSRGSVLVFTVYLSGAGFVHYLLESRNPP